MNRRRPLASPTLSFYLTTKGPISMAIEFNSWLVDRKIKGINVGVTMTIAEYWNFAEDIIAKNDLQRRRVKVSGKTYQLLGRDLIDGCVMPPIILAVSEDSQVGFNSIISSILKSGSVSEDQKKNLASLIREAIEKKHLIILDGLQRTFTIQDLVSDSDQETLEKLFSSEIRAEIYVGLSRTGILYRMITLNTGQNPMSLRHQIEMLYQDYLDNDILLKKGVALVKEADDQRILNLGEYKLSDVSDMYYSFSTGTHNSYSKQTISTILKESEFLEGFQPESAEDLSDLIVTYDKLIRKFDHLFPQWTFDPDSIQRNLGGTPFARDMIIFGSKVQVMAGFGAALHRLVKRSAKLENLESVRDIVEQVRVGEELDHPMDWLVFCLDEVRAKSKKVGDSQRAYFNYFFRLLFNDDEECFLNISDSMIKAKEAYDNVYGS